jgi:hypothetical protein
MTPLPERLTYVVCTYGRTKHLSECLECYVRRNDKRSQMLIFNDFPQQTLDCRVPGVAIINANRRYDSLGQKRMAAALCAQTDRVLFVDDDDIFLPHYAETLMRRAKDSGVPSVWASTHWAGSGVGDAFSLRLAACPVPGTFLTTKWALVLCGGFPAMNSGEDQAIRDRLHPQTIADMPTPGYIYRWANGVYHVSGAGNAAAWGGCEADLHRRVKSGEEPTGEVWIEPRWDVDYAAKCAAELHPATG